MHVRGNLHFSQSSQPTASQNLTTALEQCNLASQDTMAMSQETEPLPLQVWNSSQQDAGESCTQEGFLCTPDFATPQDQQYEIIAEGADPAAVQLRSPAALSPSRVKRPRNAAPFDGNSSQPSQSQLSQPDQGNGMGNIGNGGFPMPQNRKLLRKRYHSPPCLRNTFLHGHGNTPPALPKAPLPSSRYRADFKEIRLLGTGNFSKVYLAQHRLDGVSYAVKRSIRPVCSDAIKRQWVQEVHALAAVGDHPNIVKYVTAWIEKDAAMDGEHLYIQLEACDTSLGNLRALKDETKEGQLLEILRQITLALQHMHARNMVHMDVKPDNIYIVDDTMYKLGDLGLATSSCSGNCNRIEEGDARYIPAEVLKGDVSDLQKADIFMLGITLYELATNLELPTGGASYQSLRQGKLSLVANVPTPLFNMMRSMMTPNPADRPSPDKILSSALFAKKAQKENKSHHAFGGLNLQPSRVK
ncbi:TPA: hypothetical protein ACH3X3_009300 [Trebouxia sp. C0006]